jgi:long-chain acyl-CoA synthetase
VGLHAVNSDAFAIAYAGIVKAGASVVPINTLLNPKEEAWILADSRAVGLIHDARFAESAAAARGALSGPRLSVSIGGAVDGAHAFEDLAREDGPAPDLRFDPLEDVVAILYTSGTTGQPKGAMLTHRNLISNTASIQRALRFEPGRDIFLVVLPMFHSFAATVGVLFPLLHGCTVVPVPRFEPELVARSIEATRATIFLGVPSMFSVLLRLADEFVEKFSSLRFCVSGGAALPVDTMERFEARFAKLIYEGDGPTECSPVTCVNPIDGLRKPSSVGLPIPEVEMRILDEGGAELPDGTVGEICVRGPNVMKGYWERAEETREAFFGEWFRTGDLGYRDADGYFFIVDRKKDMVIVNGMNVYPRVIEDVLYRHPAVRDAAVVGQPHKLHGEIPVAYVVLKDGGTATAREILDFCRESLGSHEIPRRVHFRPDLPRTTTGKILKRELRLVGETERGVEVAED